MNRKILTLATVALLSVSGAVYAGQQKPKTPAASTAAKPAKAAPMHTTSGTVSSINTSQLTLSPGKGKKDLTFMLGADTQRPTNVASGDKVTVHYRVDNGQNMATSIQIQPAKNAGATAKKKT